jgi:hypothetical protein
VDASGAIESCTDAWTEAENTSAAYATQATTITVAGTANQVTSSAGAQSLAANRTWTLSLAGPHNYTTLTDHGVLVGSGTSAIDALSVGTNGQLLVGSTGADPVFATANCATGLTCTLGAGTFQIDVDDSYLLNNGDVGTGNYDFGGATFFEIPNGAGNTADDPGEIAHDTTDNQLILDDFVVGKATERIWAVTVASTSPAFIEGGLLAIPLQLDGYIITAIRCYVLGGTSKVIAVEDASANSTEDITCATTATSDDGSITNATFTAAELGSIDFGATSGSVNYVTIAVFGTWTRE